MITGHKPFADCSLCQSLHLEWEVRHNTYWEDKHMAGCIKMMIIVGFVEHTMIYLVYWLFKSLRVTYWPSIPAIPARGQQNLSSSKTCRASFTTVSVKWWNLRSVQILLPKTKGDPVFNVSKTTLGPSDTHVMATSNSIYHNPFFAHVDQYTIRYNRLSS